MPSERRSISIAAFRDFCRIDLGRERVPDATTLLGFRHLLEEHKIGAALFAKDFDLSWSAYGIAIELQPTNSDLWMGLGSLYKLHGHTKAARDAYRRALAIDPGNDDARWLLADCQAVTNDAPIAKSYPEAASGESGASINLRTPFRGAPPGP